VGGVAVSPGVRIEVVANKFTGGFMKGAKKKRHKVLKELAKAEKKNELKHEQALVEQLRVIRKKVADITAQMEELQDLLTEMRSEGYEMFDEMITEPIQDRINLFLYGRE
jgi:seryl-tRNA synthetase